MKPINDVNDPDLLGLIEYEDEFVDIAKIVDNLNKDLVDSGFDQYQYEVEKRGKKAYLRLV